MATFKCSEWSFLNIYITDILLLSTHVAMWRPLAQLCVAGALWFCLHFVCYEYHATGELCDSHRLSQYAACAVWASGRRVTLLGLLYPTSQHNSDSTAPVLDLSENYEDFNPGLGLYNLIENF